MRERGLARTCSARRHAARSPWSPTACPPIGPAAGATPTVPRCGSPPSASRVPRAAAGAARRRASSRPAASPTTPGSRSPGPRRSPPRSAPGVDGTPLAESLAIAVRRPGSAAGAGTTRRAPTSPRASLGARPGRRARPGRTRWRSSTGWSATASPPRRRCRRRSPSPRCSPATRGRVLPARGQPRRRLRHDRRHGRRGRRRARRGLPAGPPGSIRDAARPRPTPTSRSTALAGDLLDAAGRGRPRGGAGRRVVSLGSILVDIAVHVPALPERGGDVLASDADGWSRRRVQPRRRRRPAGRAVRYAAPHGTGPRGDLVRAALAAEGITVAGAPADRRRHRASASCCVEPDGERTFVTAPGVEAALTADDLAALRVRAADVVAVSGYDLLYPGSGPVLADLDLGALPRADPRRARPGPAGARRPRRAARRRPGPGSRCSRLNQREARLLGGRPGRRGGGPRPGGAGSGSRADARWWSCARGPPGAWRPAASSVRTGGRCPRRGYAPSTPPAPATPTRACCSPSSPAGGRSRRRWPPRTAKPCS